MNPSLKTLGLTLVLLGLARPAVADPALPIGIWDNVFQGKPGCSSPALSIEQGRIIHRLDEGQGRCKVTSLKRNGRTLLGRHTCDWDASVPQGLRESQDGDDDGFSLVVKSPTRILYNNGLYGLCPAATGTMR